MLLTERKLSIAVTFLSLFARYTPYNLHSSLLPIELYPSIHLHLVLKDILVNSSSLSLPPPPLSLSLSSSIYTMAVT